MTVVGLVVVHRWEEICAEKQRGADDAAQRVDARESAAHKTERVLHCDWQGFVKQLFRGAALRATAARKIDTLCLPFLSSFFEFVLPCMWLGRPKTVECVQCMS